MSLVTKKLPTSKKEQLLAYWHGLLDRCDIYQLAGGGFCLILTLAVCMAAFWVHGSGKSETLGEWQPLISRADALRAINIHYDPQSGHMQLEEREGGLHHGISEKNRQYIRAHIKRFNKHFQNRRYDAARVPGDCLFVVNLDSKDKTPRLSVRDLSAYNTAPNNERSGSRELGAIYMTPSEQPTPYLSDGRLGLFLDPSDAGKAQISLSQDGLFHGGGFTLTDAEGGARASVRAGENGTHALIKPEGGRAIFIDNNPATAEESSLEAGKIVEIAGRFFETRIEKSVVLARSTERDGGKRIYPMAANLHFVGPISPGDTHQSLGLEYMFREYLEGLPAEDIPPGELWLTLDPALQSELSRNIKNLAKNSASRGKGANWHLASGLIMNAKTGAILAVASDPLIYDPGKRDQIHQLLDQGNDRYANHGSFKSHVVGSVCKPFFGFLGLHLMPEVEQMVIHGSSTETLFGHRPYGYQGRGKKKYFKYKRDVCDFGAYIAHSDNAYQHSLGMLMFAGIDSLDQVPSAWRVKGQSRYSFDPSKKIDHLELGTLGAKENRLLIESNNPFAQAFESIFEISTQADTGEMDDRDISIYEPLNSTMTSILNLRYPDVEDPTTILKRRSAVCAPETTRMSLASIKNTMDSANILFGANGNRWSDVQLCESFSRLVTGRKVEARMIYKYVDTLAKPDNNGYPEVIAEKEAPYLSETGIHIEDHVFKTMRKHLEQVAVVGTAAKMRPAIREIQSQAGMKQFKLFVKTGTIDDNHKQFDSRLLLGTFGLWNPSRNDFDGTALTFVFYLKHAVNEDAILDVAADALPRWWLLQQTQPTTED